MSNPFQGINLFRQSMPIVPLEKPEPVPQQKPATQEEFKVEVHKAGGRAVYSVRSDSHEHAALAVLHSAAYTQEKEPVKHLAIVTNLTSKQVCAYVLNRQLVGGSLCLFYSELKGYKVLE